MTNKILLLIILTFIKLTGIAQKSLTNYNILSTDTVKALFTGDCRNSLNINYPIFRVYRYSDQSDIHYVVLTESLDKSIASSDTIHNKIKAFNFTYDNGTYTKIWEINDSKRTNPAPESSIWFWTKYVDFIKGKNGETISIITYGTHGNNGYSDGRIKFIIYHKGNKIAIRHQNGVLDDERETQIDKAFYDLPLIIQQTVIKKMDLMEENNHAIFPRGWKDAMLKKKTIINER